jgi:hypothetical protein
MEPAMTEPAIHRERGWLKPAPIDPSMKADWDRVAEAILSLAKTANE